MKMKEINLRLFFRKKGATDTDAIDMGKLLKMIYGDQIEVVIGKGDKILYDSKPKTVRQELPDG